MVSQLIIKNLDDINTEINNNYITENQYLELSKDCKNRIDDKNKIINDMQKKIIMIWTLLNLYLEEEDEIYLDDLKNILEKSLIENIGIQELD